jgi:hypothetical protein
MMAMTKQHIKLLAECERMMDAEQIPCVRFQNERIMCSQACLEELGLIAGQTINQLIFVEILKWSIADCEAKITEQKLREEGAG